jgi:hypothetical protein
MPCQVLEKAAPASAALPESVKEKSQKACEFLAEKGCQEALEEYWEVKVIKLMEKQAAEEKAVKEHTEKTGTEAAQKAAEVAWKATTAKINSMYQEI